MRNSGPIIAAAKGLGGAIRVWRSSVGLDAHRGLTRRGASGFSIFVIAGEGAIDAVTYLT